MAEQLLELGGGGAGAGWEARPGKASWWALLVGDGEGGDWISFSGDEMRFALACGKGPDDRWHGQLMIMIQAGALRRFSLHPDQRAAP